MCSELQPKIKMSKVTVVMSDGQEFGPVKIVGLKEVMTKQGPFFAALLYGNKSVLPQGPSHARFIAVYTNLEHRKGKAV
jgi:hypothetical protein